VDFTEVIVVTAGIAAIAFVIWYFFGGRKQATTIIKENHRDLIVGP
jgi:hypothetical protein